MEIHNKNENIRESGDKQSTISKRTFIDKNPVDKRGNPLPMVVAMVAKCVAHYRRFMKPLKTIYLCPVYYVQFTDWVRSRCTEEEGDYNKYKMLTFDGVELEMMDKHHVIRAKDGNDSFDYDFYPQTLND